MAYFTFVWDSLKEALQGSAEFSADLTAFNTPVALAMSTDWDVLVGDEWMTAYLGAATLYYIGNIPSSLFSLAVGANVLTLKKNNVRIAEFRRLSDGTWQATLPDLNIAGWVKHP